MMNKWILFLMAMLSMPAPFWSQNLFDTSFGGEGTGYIRLDSAGNTRYIKTTVTREKEILLLGIEEIDPITNVFKLRRLQENGVPDETFGTNGFTSLHACSFDQPWVPIYQLGRTGKFQLLEQSDGKILIGAPVKLSGQTGFAYLLVRLNPDGSLDTGFAEDGFRFLYMVQNAPRVMTFSLDVQDRIVLAGSIDSRMAAWRWTPDGDPDLSFGEAGAVILPSPLERPGWERADEIWIEPDGKLVLTGTIVEDSPECEWDACKEGFILARLLPDGMPDPDFGYDGVAFHLTNGTYFSFFTSTSTPDGGYLVHEYCGDSGMYYWKMTTEGALDPIFGSNGVHHVIPRAATPVSQDGLLVDPDGRIWAGLSFYNDPAWRSSLRRYLPDFTRDMTFYGHGEFEIPEELNAIRFCGIVRQGDQFLLNYYGGEATPYYTTLIRINPDYKVSVETGVVFDHAIELSPNPAQDYIRIHWPGAQHHETIEIQLVDITGRTLYEAVTSGFELADQVLIQVPDHIADGFVMVMIRSGEALRSVPVMMVRNR